MARNRTTGVIQVADNSVPSINVALQQVLNLVDGLKGVRGPATVNDRLAVEEPEDPADAVNKGSLQVRNTLWKEVFLAGGACGLAVITPGTSYTEVGRNLRSRVNFEAPAALEARIVVNGWGSEATFDKGVALYTLDGTQICEVTWNGQDEGVKLGDYVELGALDDSGVAIYAKGSSTTENLVLRYVAVEFRLTAGSSLDA
jgi:hypothetical protein